MKHFISWILIKQPSDLFNDENSTQIKSSSSIFFRRNHSQIFTSGKQIHFFQNSNKSKINKIVNPNNCSLGEIQHLNKHNRNFSNDFVIMPQLNIEKKNNNNMIKNMRTTRLFQSIKKNDFNKIKRIKINKRNSFNDLPSLKRQKKKMIEKLIYKEGENDTNGNNLYDDDKDDKFQKIYIENNCTIVKESLTKPYIKNKKNQNQENKNNEDNYGKKIQNNNLIKIKIPKIETNKYHKNKIIERMKKEKYQNFMNINNASMRNMKNNFLNIFYNDIQNLKKEINQINKKIFNIYVEGKNIFNQ